METLLWTGFAIAVLSAAAAAAPYHQRMIASRRTPQRAENLGRGSGDAMRRPLDSK
jgi:hypothetical protein